jgi:hypothetical protein
MAVAAQLLQLKEMIALKEGRLHRERLPSSTLSCGLPKAAITEITGTAKIEWVIQFLKENPTLKVFWVETKFSLYPPALYLRGLNTNRFVFAECGAELFLSLRKALRCQVFECVISPSVFSELKKLKALQLLTEKANCSLILLAERASCAWPIQVQFDVHRDQIGLQVFIKKNKGGQEIGEIK